MAAYRNRVRCTAHNRKTKQRCGAWAIAGGTVCIKHGGAAPRTAEKAAIRHELLKWGIPEQPDIDAGALLLGLLEQSRNRIVGLSAALANLAEENDGDLVKALTSDTYITTSDGDTVKVGEHTRAIADMEARERDRAANLAAVVVRSGLEQRRVEIAENMSHMLALIIGRVLRSEVFGLTEEQLALGPALIRENIALAQIEAA